MWLVLICVLLATLYWYGTRNHGYWKSKGVPYEKPLPFFGSNIKYILNNVSLTERLQNFYEAYPKERYVGFYRGNEPAVLLRDPELIKRVLSTDFRQFHYRGINLNAAHVEPLFKNLFAAEGDVWRLTRQKLTPAFTTSKLKAMFPLIVETAATLVNIVNQSEQDEIDTRDLMARYTIDFIGSCGFGINSNSLNDETSGFRQLGKRIATITKRDALVFVLKRTAPDLFKHLTYLAPEIETKLVSIVKQIVEQRNHKPSGRNDFIDMMLELKQKGNIRGESIEHQNPDGSPMIVEIEFDDLLMCAQAFVFFIAGFETSSSASSYLLHNLAYNPDHLKRCQDEVDEVLSRYDGKLCFDAVKEMKYLEMCLKESLRILPPIGFLMRKCVNRYTFPDTDLTVEKDMVMMIPTQGLHFDPQYFEDPQEFKPERFSSDDVDKIKNYTYMPFGDGPRACIGERLGLMQSLAGVATVLRHFDVSPGRSSVRRPPIDPSSTIFQTIPALPLHLKPRVH
ncbi:cytochrome P450 6B2-like [Aricia agestis]|uniref:cytochrome P450 6B2-like n=1 Tax=Aricia agestis TaxID=91739 RepID=UPI001C209192|nr:cytochrome P450 6B2-like [Aricia agestis]